jgi:hypothetical protein
VGARSRTVEEICADLASRSHGIVTRRELIAAGVTRREIGRRLERGHLIREFPGVYRVGHRAPSVEARYMAAVRACGPRAVLSGPTAAYLLGLIRKPPPIPHVTAPRERAVRGIVTRRSSGIEAAEYRGIPVTTVAMTLVDNAATLSLDDLARACHEAGVRYGTTPGQVEEVLARRPTSPGAGRLRAVLRGKVPVTLSGLERRFLKLLRDHGLPSPVTNRVSGSVRVDCRWPEHALTVELDSYRYHHSRHAWERDRRREREARARGDDFRRYTYGDVFDAPALMLEELRSSLAKRAA